MNHWKIKFELQKTDNGFNVSANIPTKPAILRHEDTIEDVVALLNNLPDIVEEVDDNLNPPKDPEE